MQLKTVAQESEKEEEFKYSYGIYMLLREVTKRQAQTIDKECALCGTTLPVGSEISICRECIKCADCCVGLESLRD